jgi:hypothetical protein
MVEITTSTPIKFRYELLTQLGEVLMDSWLAIKSGVRELAVKIKNSEPEQRKEDILEKEYSVVLEIGQHDNLIKPYEYGSYAQRTTLKEEDVYVCSYLN